MTDDSGHSGNSVSDEMREYLQVFLDETEEQLEDLVEVLLVLEREPHRVEQLNEAFRLIHTIKGSAGMMGIKSIPTLTHHLETRFEAFRSGVRTLDSSTMNLVLRCIDFLRECVRRLRAGELLGSSAELLEELASESEPGVSVDVQESVESEVTTSEGDTAEMGTAAQTPDPLSHVEAGRRIAVVFEPNLPLADLKARLILSRLAAIGEIASTSPDASVFDTVASIDRLEVVLIAEHDADVIRESVDLDGVQRVEVGEVGSGALAGGTPGEKDVAEEEEEEEEEATVDSGAVLEPPVVENDLGCEIAVPEDDGASAPLDGVSGAAESAPRFAVPDVPERAKTRAAGTIRVDIDRLDRLMNLAGELVVNRARFVQVTSQVGRSLSSRNMVSRVRDVSEALRRTIEQLETTHGGDAELVSCVEDLRSGLDCFDEQAEIWNRGRTCFVQIGEAIDQLTRIADSLQQSVLGTRMVPVAPLFNRFNRVVRDLSNERGKDVHLEIRGEKTELDKRMIDELGDPLVHLVRNALDHGLEAPEVRRARGKAESGTIRLEASHSGNNVFISVRDDGGGIDVARVREKIVERGLLPSDIALGLSESEALEYIWHAGFSTASEVTDISGRGVGMDVVRARIADLNGSVEISSTPEVGTTFTIRLPLTLAIINSLLIRIRESVFSMPIDEVREIVSVRAGDIVTVRGKRAIEVRGEYIPLIEIDDVFEWHGEMHCGNGSVEGGEVRGGTEEGLRGGVEMKAVILHAGGRTMGLRVDEPLGSEDIVIKSLSENFVAIRGLSGASILGDGTVCLMLDVGSLIEMAIPNRIARVEGAGA